MVMAASRGISDSSYEFRDGQHLSINPLLWAAKVGSHQRNEVIHPQKVGQTEAPCQHHVVQWRTICYPDASGIAYKLLQGSYTTTQLLHKWKSVCAILRFPLQHCLKIRYSIGDVHWDGNGAHVEDRHLDPQGRLGVYVV